MVQFNFGNDPIQLVKVQMEELEVAVVEMEVDQIIQVVLVTLQAQVPHKVRVVVMVDQVVMVLVVLVVVVVLQALLVPNGRSPTPPATQGYGWWKWNSIKYYRISSLLCGWWCFRFKLRSTYKSSRSQLLLEDQGGGGNGSVAANQAAGGDGTDNLGGGGGGSDQPAGTTRNANGGSGVVILSVARCRLFRNYNRKSNSGYRC